MKARTLIGSPHPDGPDWRLPYEVLGAYVGGIAEILQDNGQHQAYGLVLVCPGGRRLALWWQREPVRRWALTPI